MAARKVLQTATDQDAAVLRFVGIGEIHILFRQERAQMFVDLFQRGVSEGFIGAPLGLPFLDFRENGLVLDDLDARRAFSGSGSLLRCMRARPLSP